MIKLVDIYKAYPGVEVLKGVNFEVQQKEIVAIVGPSGAGKSTLLHILGTLDKPDKGQLLFNGEDLFAKKDKALSLFRNKKIGFVFQFHNLLPEFTAIENITLPAMIGGMAEADALPYAKELLAYIGLEHRANHRPNELSGGEQQRVAICRALINKPDLILADEPTGNLDSANADEINQLFFKLRDDFGHTFIIVTHNDKLSDLTDRKIIMKDGIVVN